jgi:hypothetical protein
MRVNLFIYIVATILFLAFCLKLSQPGELIVLLSHPLHLIPQLFVPCIVHIQNRSHKSELLPLFVCHLIDSMLGANQI